MHGCMTSVVVASPWGHVAPMVLVHPLPLPSHGQQRGELADIQRRHATLWHSTSRPVTPCHVPTPPLDACACLAWTQPLTAKLNPEGLTVLSCNNRNATRVKDTTLPVTRLCPFAPLPLIPRPRHLAPLFQRLLAACSSYPVASSPYEQTDQPRVDP